MRMFRLQEKPPTLQKALQNIKFLHFILFLGTILARLYPHLESKLNPVQKHKMNKVLGEHGT